MHAPYSIVVLLRFYEVGYGDYLFARVDMISLNLDSLLIQLQDKVTRKWHQFGVALGIEKEILDRCRNYPPEQSIIEMLDHWLRNYEHEKCNWRDVARALRQIKFHQLAKEIESIDKTGECNNLMQ